MKKPGTRIGFSRSVAELVPAIGRKAFRRFGFVESAIVARWPEIVGTAYAQHSTPESIRFPQGKRSGGVLRLSVSGAHALTLQHVEPQIVERVNRFFGYDAISRIAIQQGRAPEKRPQPEAAQVPGEIPADVAGSLKTIADDGLRNSLEDLARQLSVTRGPPIIR